MKIWNERFSKESDKMADRFNQSLSYDHRLYRLDIKGSIAYATMLKETGILSAADADAIIKCLDNILHDINTGKLTFINDAEDIHMFIESCLTERIGDAGKRIHTGRSRNDQVALDMRLYCKEACDETIVLIKNLMGVLLTLAQDHINTLMPGYTHMQKAQPITLAFHLMAYFNMFARDVIRLSHAHQSADVLPLGSGALAGTSYPIDRSMLACLLGFSRISSNALDAVSDRDFILDYLSSAATCAMHISRLSEEIILWNTDEFRFIDIDDGFATGSSMMPQKKNPDMAELSRAKTGRIYGHLLSMLTVMKGLPLAYNKDMQEDKEALFDTHDTLVMVLSVMTGMLQSLVFNTEQMSNAANQGYINATDCADYLVKKGIPFRDAYRAVGKLVVYCVEKNKALIDLSLEEITSFHQAFDHDVFEAISLSACINKRSLPGGTAAQAVINSIEEGKQFLLSL